jgi:hypothetical protein
MDLKNLDNFVGKKEIGSKDFIVLNQIANNINSRSRFEGEIDDQIILDDDKYNTKSQDVYTFLKRLIK